MNSTLTIALLGQAGVGKSFVGNNLVYYLQSKTIPDEEIQLLSTFAENYNIQAQIYKMGSPCITKEYSINVDQMRINILETIAIGQLQGASRKKSCQMIIEEIKKKYQNVEKQLEGDNLKDFYDYCDSFEDKKNTYIFLNQRDYQRKNISDYILQSYVKQNDFYNQLFTNMKELCGIFNFGSKNNLEQIDNKQDWQKIEQNNNQYIANNNINTQGQINYPNNTIEKKKDKKILFVYHENSLPEELIIDLNLHHIQIMKSNQISIKVDLILIDFSKLKKFYNNKQKEFLTQLQKFKTNFVLFYTRNQQLDNEIESLIQQNQWKLLRDWSIDSFVTWMDRIHQPINLDEIIHLLDKFF